MQLRHSLCWILIGIAAGASHPGSRAGADERGSDRPDNDVAEVYLAEVKPLLKTKCVSCHGGLKQSGGLRLDTARAAVQGGDSGPALKPGDARASLLWLRVTSEDKDERMPPDAEPLTAGELQSITAWIEAGAHWPVDEVPQSDPREHWAFQPLALPTVPDSDGLAPIDAFVAARLKTAGLDLAPPADPAALVRRLALDVTGIVPEWDTFHRWVERLERAPEDVDQFIDSLLASPRHGEHAAQQWLDVVRYADTHGFEVNTPRPNAWPYRDYVIAALNADKPYNRFVAEQIAGDQFDADAATGFLVAAPVLLPGQIGKDEASKRLARQDALDEVVSGTSATFLGLTIGCARCHDHKFDPISQRDYYALQAFFAGIEYGDRVVRDQRSRRREEELKTLAPRIEELTAELESVRPGAAPGRWIVIDDEAPQRTEHLTDKRGHGDNPKGDQPGYRDDVGSKTRSANISRGRYTWWTNSPGRDVFTWNPATAGRFRVWLSWGVHGSGVHTRDARYVIDADGDLNTKDDQREIARVDQYYPAGVHQGQTETQPLWSDFLDVGIHELGLASRIVLRGGDSGSGITADVLVLERVDPSDTDDLAQVGTCPPQLRGPVSPLRNVERFEPCWARFVRLTTLETIDENKHEPCIDEIEIFAGGVLTDNLARRAGVRVSSSGDAPVSDRHKLEHINDGRYGNSRSWMSDRRGGGWVQLELPEPVTIDTIVWGRDRQGRLRDRLPVRYRLEVSVDGNAWQIVADESDRAPYGSPYDEARALERYAQSRARGNDSFADLASKLDELDLLHKRKLELETPETVFAAVSRDCDATHLLNRGDPEQPLEPVAPALPGVVGSLSLAHEMNDAERRRSLADWFNAPTSALVARVIVNRIWQNHFGSGLVETPSDFGLNGARPSHPELLEWLAAELVAHQWSLNWLERSILRSRTYQQSSHINAKASAVDADNRWLWRFPARRMSAEAIRDSVLRVSGNLNLEMGGPGFDFYKVRGGLSGFPPLEKFTARELRRMVYSHKIRMERVPVFGAFDCPDAGQPSPKRSQSTTPIQALNLFNSEFIAEQSEAFAKRVLRDLSSGSATDEVDTRCQIEHAFSLALGRSPAAVEASAAAEIVSEHGLAVLCRVLLNSNEFLFLP